MALIEVNHKSLRDVATAINAYCAAQDKEMIVADTSVKEMLASDWLGTDAQTFGQKWGEIVADDSTTVKFRKSLKAFGEGLVASANEYKKAQQDSYNAANWLPKYLYW
jgi:hypothetical protein